MKAKLITHESNKDRTFEVGESGLTIGRHIDNQASLDDSRLSRFHARIVFKDGAWYAEDLGSTNGSFLNDKQFQGEVKLSPGDKLRFGATNAELVWEDAASGAAKPAENAKKATAPIEPPKATPPEVADLKTAATIVAPLSSIIAAEAAKKEEKPAEPLKPVVLTPVTPAAPVKPAEPEAPAAPASGVVHVKPLVITPASPEEIAALEGLTPVEGAAPAPAASPLKPAGKPLIRKPVAGAGLRPGLKLPPKPTGLKPGLKLPPKPSFHLKPGLKLPPKPGAAPAK